MLSIICQHYSDNNYVFGTDLLHCCIMQKTHQCCYFNAEDINFVTKKNNAANCPETSTIEDFWGYLKGYDGKFFDLMESVKPQNQEINW